MSWSIDTCQTKVSVDQNHATILQAQAQSSSLSHFFLTLTADQGLVFDWIVGSC